MAARPSLTIDGINLFIRDGDAGPDQARRSRQLNSGQSCEQCCPGQAQTLVNSQSGIKLLAELRGCRIMRDNDRVPLNLSPATSLQPTRASDWSLRRKYGL